MKTCSCCGQTLPPELPEDMGFKRSALKLVERVRRAGKRGVDRDTLFDYLYADDPDGGPLCGVRSLYVRIWQINQRLMPFGKVIRAAPSGGKGNFSIYVYRDL